MIATKQKQIKMLVPQEPGPYYTHLGFGESVASLRQQMEQRTGLVGRAIRFEKILYTGKEGKTVHGCPIAKWIIRRSSLEEKVLCLIKERRGHRCQTTWLIVISVAWEGLALKDSDYLYGELVYRLNAHGVATNRRCATNEDRTCACQGLDPETCGASFSFGCSWSMFFNGCKFARSKSQSVRKFRLSDESQETDIGDRLQRFATAIAPLFQRIAPDAYANQVEFEKAAIDCRLGLMPGRPFAGVTACFDFCAHSHRDIHDMNNGCTVVTTLTRHRGFHKPTDDEQLHVLPHYILDGVDEYNSVEGQRSKVDSGAIEILNKYPSILRRHSQPIPSKTKRKAQIQSNRVIYTAANEDTALVQSSHVTSSTYYERHPSRTFLEQSGSMESKIRALQTSSQTYRPAVDHLMSNPAFASWGGYTPPPQQQCWQQPPWHNRPSDPQLSQWWRQNLSSPSSEMRPFGPVNPVQPFQNVIRHQPPLLTEPRVTVQVSDNEENFKDPSIGGVAIALTHGSVLFECAKHELHATTALRNPNRRNPTRISLVLYQHRNMNESKHGFDINEKKMERKRIEQQRQEEAQTTASTTPQQPTWLPAPNLYGCTLPASAAASCYPNSQQPVLPSIHHAFPYHLSYPYNP